MSFLRLGTRCAVINEHNEILLSKRGDFGTWGLPGGRLDEHELLPDATVREVREETGLIVRIERAVGLYYQEGRQRMNVLYRARSTGGELLDSTRETTANRFFSPDDLPEPLFGQFYIDHAYSEKIHLYTVETPLVELLSLQVKLGIRWMQNLLAGHPEPSFPEFRVRAVGILWNLERDAVWSPESSLPRINSNGRKPLHHLLDEHLQRENSVNIDWQWVGLWQDTASNELEFIFAAPFSQGNQTGLQWQPVDALPARDRAYIDSIRHEVDPVWMIAKHE